MNEVFLKVVNTSISASYLVLAVLVLRLVFKKAPKWVSVLLWGIVAVRLVCPFSIESVFSLLPSAQVFQPATLIEEPSIQTGIPIVNQTINPMLQESVVTIAPEKSVNLLKWSIWAFSRIWAVGSLVCLVYSAVSYCLLRRRVATAVRLRDNIFQSEYVASPFVLGIIRPKIYLPFRMDGQALSHVIAHERAHIMRKDHLWKPAGFLLLSIHWFNPLMWLGYILLCRDIELACDEKVIKKMDSENRADYTQALVTCGVSRRRIAACPLAFGEVGVKARVKSVLNYKVPAFWIIVAAVIVCIAVAVCFLTNPMDQVALKDLKQDEINMPGTLSDVTDLNITYKGVRISCTEKPEINRFLATLDKINVSKKPISLNRSGDRSKAFTVQVNGNTELHFNESFTKLWVDDHVKPSLTHRVANPETAKELILDYNFTTSAVGGVDTPSSIDIRPYRDTLISEYVALSNEPESPLDAAISDAIFAYHNKDLPDEMITTESHAILAREDAEDVQEVTVYIMYHYAQFTDRNIGNAYQYTLEGPYGGGGTAAITFTITEDGEYILKEFWEPRDDANYQKDVRSKFPIETVKFLLIDHEARMKLETKLDKKCRALANRYHLKLNLDLYDQPKSNPENQIFGSTMSWAGWADANALYMGGLNREKMARSAVRHLPIYKFESRAELERFIGENPERKSGRGDVRSVQENFGRYVEDFFEINTLLLVYISSDSTDDRYGVTGFYCDQESFVLHVEELADGEPNGREEAGWFVTVAVANSLIEGCSVFDAYI